ncbi:hypothetical protein WA026_023705 [Henosepilachna vigintioctopunctata]|uniref:Uncharacterized protein n=1 Tax=Henosepilachna vigintioctopunctata TaxID=420089 RepID=A0AAW1UQ83_9CUCU
MDIVRDIGQDITEDAIVEHGRGAYTDYSILRRKFRCVKCGNHRADGKSCDRELMCIFCKEPHIADNRECLKYKRQQRHRGAMAYYNVSFYEVNIACKGAAIPSFNDFPQNAHKKAYSTISKETVNTVHSYKPPNKKVTIKNLLHLRATTMKKMKNLLSSSYLPITKWGLLHTQGLQPVHWKYLE